MIWTINKFELNICYKLLNIKMIAGKEFDISNDHENLWTDYDK
jgi:hypothetical protein